MNFYAIILKPSIKIEKKYRCLNIILKLKYKPNCQKFHLYAIMSSFSAKYLVRLTKQPIFMIGEFICCELLVKTLSLVLVL